MNEINIFLMLLKCSLEFKKVFFCLKVIFSMLGSQSETDSTILEGFKLQGILNFSEILFRDNF